MARPLAALAAVVCVATWLAGSAAAGPLLEVRARARLTLERVRRTPEGVQIVGRLGDGGEGGISGLDVTVRVEGQEVVATTSAGGRFVAELTLTDGRYVLEGHFNGAPHLDPATLGPLDIEVGKATLGLIVRPPPAVPTTAAALEVLVEAASDSGPAAATVRVTAGDAASGTARVETTITLDGSGRGTVSMPIEQLGDAGPKWVRARVEAGAAWNPAEVEASFTLVSETRFEALAMPSEPVEHEGRVIVTGRLEGGAGEPIARAAVALQAAGRAVVSAPTDERGNFRLEVPAAELAPGPVSLAVAFSSPVAWRTPAVGPAVLLEIRPPAPLPLAYTLVALVLALTALAWFLLARTRPWRPLLLALRRRRAPPRPGAQVAGAPEGPRGGLVRARPSIVSTLRRPASTRFSGRIWDAARGRRVPGAIVQVGAGGALALIEAGVDGAFDVPSLPAGEHPVEISARGFVPEQFVVTIPHRGELEGVRVDLVPVRERVYQIFKLAAAPVVPAQAVLEVWTAREVAHHVAQAGTDRSLGPLAALTEDACYAPAQPEVEVVGAAERLAVDLGTPGKLV